MNGKDDLRKIVDDFLVDDGLDRDIVLLANQMGIDVGYDYFSEISSSNEYEFIAFIYMRAQLCNDFEYFL